MMAAMVSPKKQFRSIGIAVAMLVVLLLIIGLARWLATG